MKKALVFVGVIAVVGVILGTTALYMSWKEVARGPNSLTAQNATASNGAVNGQTSPAAITTAPTTNLEPGQASDVSTMQQLNSAQINELLAWKTAHGYADFHRDFGGLSERELLSFAQAGEIGALHVLASRHAHKQPDKAIEYYQKAAVHGSTYALVLIGELYMFHATDDGLIEEVKTEENGALHALAYNFAAQLLGDNAVTPIQSTRLIDTVLGEALSDTSVTEHICRNTRSIVDGIQETRTANGYVPHAQSIAPYSSPVDTSVSVYSFCGSIG